MKLLRDPRVAGALALALLESACGYRPELAGDRPTGRLSVTSAAPRVPHAGAVDASLLGARARLSRAGALSSGSTFPKMVVEILRVDEAPAGIAATMDDAGNVIPLERGSRVGVLGRAWVLERSGAEPTRDTGDMRRVARHSARTNPRWDAVGHHDAVRAAARRLGGALAGRILGEPEPSIEPL